MGKKSSKKGGKKGASERRYRKRCLDNLSREMPLHWRGSFGEYLDALAKNPGGQLRTARQYLYDAILSFGTAKKNVEHTDEEITHYNLFTAELPFRKEFPVHGMDRSLEVLMEHLESRAMRMHDLPRMIVLNGPPGSSKSSTVERLKAALEEYSLSDEGAAFTTTVVLPLKDDPHKRKELGFITGDSKKGKSDGSYARLPQDEVYAQITCPQHDSPLLWIPREKREEVLGELISGAGFSPDDFEIPEELLYGGLCPVCSQVYDHLMAEHGDSWEEVIRHVSVDRYSCKADTSGFATVTPGTSSNFTALSLAMDPNYQRFSERFPGIRLVELDGSFIKANRGMVHLEDFVKASHGDLTYLLRAISNGQLTTKDLRTGKEITITVDEVILSTDNVEEIDAIRKRGSKGFDSRIFVIDWPYVTEASEEEKIYRGDFAERGRSGEGREGMPHLAPHVERLAAMFSVMTRYERPDPEHSKRVEHYSADVEKLIRSLTPLDKALLYEGIIPERFTKEEVKLLTKPLWRAIRTEYPNEGITGVGVRDMQEMVNMLAPDEKCGCITSLDLFRVLDEFIRTDSFHYLSGNAKQGYHDVKECLTSAQKEYDRVVSREVKHAMTDISPEMICGWIREYVSVVTSNYRVKYLQGPEGIGAAEEDELEAKMAEFESLMGLRTLEQKGRFRQDVRTRVATYAEQLADLEGYHRVFPEIYHAVEESRFKQTRDRFYAGGAVRQEFLEAILAYDVSAEEDCPAEFRDGLRHILGNMQRFGYCPDCAKEALIHAVDRKLV